MKRLFFILLLMCGFVSTTDAQFYNKTLLFVQVGKDITGSTSIKIFDYDGSGNLLTVSLKAREAIEKYNNGTLDSYLRQRKHDTERDYSVDSSKYIIYSWKYVVDTVPQSTWTGSGWSTAWVPVYSGRGYYGITSDGKEVVFWRTSNNSTEPKDRKHYKQISFAELTSMVDEYGFLH